MQDDVQWERRREPYRGGPIRPGAELDGSLNGLVWAGAGIAVAGFALPIGYGLGNDQPLGAIPIVGPWIVVAGEGGGHMPPDDTTKALMALGGLAQLAGIGMFVIGLMNPSLSLVYDAPMGSPSLQVRLAPFAPGTDAGLSLLVTE